MPSVCRFGIELRVESFDEQAVGFALVHDGRVADEELQGGGVVGRGDFGEGLREGGGGDVVVVILRFA